MSILVVLLVSCVLLCRVLSCEGVDVVCPIGVRGLITGGGVVFFTGSDGFLIVGSRDVLRDRRPCVRVVSDVLRWGE